MTERTAAGRSRTGNPFTDYIGATPEEQRPGFSRIRLPVTGELLGGVAGSLHGGAVCTIVDVAAINAVASVLQDGEQMAGTAEINISFLRPAIAATVFASATLLKKGRTLAVCDVDVTTDSGRLVAKGRVSYALRPAALQRRGPRGTGTPAG